MAKAIPKRITFLSNGHGEDAVAVRLARAFTELDESLSLQAFPTVDEGIAYRREGIVVLGPAKPMPSSGLLFHSWDLFKKDIEAGFISMTLRQLVDLRKLETDVLVVVGDAYALLLSSLVKTSKRFYVQTLVSAHHKSPKTNANRYFMENISYVERMLMRQLARRVYVRDSATAEMLQSKGLSHVSALGNPMFDGLHASPLVIKGKPIIGLLPGTRRYAGLSLQHMMAALRQTQGLSALVAWAGTDVPDAFIGWHRVQKQEVGLLRAFQHENTTVYIYEGMFERILQTVDLVVATTGTAAEQAAVLGKPVISFALPPYFTQSFLDNQKRLLGDALIITDHSQEELGKTISNLLNDKAQFQKAAQAGPERLGRTGGSKAIARDILSRAFS